MHAFMYKTICILVCISSVDNARIPEYIGSSAACGLCTCEGQPPRADCSNRDLESIPTDLPVNITDLNLANNRIYISSQPSGSLCQQYPQLAKVSLAWNELETLSRIFQGCKHLEHLDLTGNNIEFPDPLAFEDLQSLQELSSIGVQELQVGMFQKLTRLETLNITLYGITIQPGVFTGLSSLKRLTLTLEKVMALPENMLSFGDSNVLKSLFIKGSKVKDIPDDLLKELVSLKELHLDLPKLLELRLHQDRKPAHLQVLEISNVRNLAEDTLFGLQFLRTVKLHGIGNLANQDLFKMAKTVKELEIVRCSMSELPAGWFNNMVALEILDLSGNGLVNLSPVDFLQLTSLKMLILSNNKINELSRGLFNSLNATLMQLHLNGNQLKKLEPATFIDLKLLELLDLRKNTIRHISVTSFSNLPQLQILRLSGNYISVLDNIAFESFPMIREIDLADNMISQFPETLIASKVVYLYLAANNLENLPGKKLCQMGKLQKLGLEDNPIFCDCPVRSLHKCLPKLEISGQCSKPVEVEGRSIEKVAECKPSPVSHLLQTLSLESGTPVASTLKPSPELSASSTLSTLVTSLSSTPKIIPTSVSLTPNIKRTEQVSSTPSLKSSEEFSQTSKMPDGLKQKNEANDDDDEPEIVRPLLPAEIPKTSLPLVTSTAGLNSTHAENSIPENATTRNETKTWSPKLWVNNGTKSLSPGMVKVSPITEQAGIWSHVDDIFSVVVLSLAVTMVILSAIWFYRRRSQTGSYNAVTSSTEVQQANIVQMQALVEQQGVIPNQKRSNMTIETHANNVQH